MPILFMLSHQRSGSHFLKQTLSCHNEYVEQQGLAAPRYLALPEVFTPGIDRNYPATSNWVFGTFLRSRVAQSPDEWGNPEGIARAAHLFIDYLEEQSHGQTILVDIKLNQLYIGEGWYHATGARPRLLYHLIRKGKVVFLRRKNLLRTILSGMLAKHTGVWHMRGLSSASLQHEQLTIDCENFLRQARQLERGLEAAEGWLDDWKRSVLRIYYEDLYDTADFTCRHEAFDHVARFAGLATGIHWHSEMQKIGIYPLSRVIANYSEFRRQIGQTEYATMLDDDFAQTNVRRSA